ncbi:MAG: hypothetical protein P4M09_26505 [Devosia sp.]|nr:hypothetical protein [Devosia sp.]
MFLVRSAFWLTVAFIAFHPRDVDLGATATALSGQAIGAGQKIVVSELLQQNCPALVCPAAPPAVAAMISHLRTAEPLLPDSATNQDAPFPRPRPAWMG